MIGGWPELRGSSGQAYKTMTEHRDNKISSDMSL
jgi:hypothetical protein